jgi:hypothetical protein
MCTLPYPDRFYAAVAFAANPPPAARGVTDETRLLLYALFQQVREKPDPEDAIGNGNYNNRSVPV